MVRRSSDLATSGGKISVEGDFAATSWLIWESEDSLDSVWENLLRTRFGHRWWPNVERVKEPSHVAEAPTGKTFAIFRCQHLAEVVDELFAIVRPLLVLLDVRCTRQAACWAVLNGWSRCTRSAATCGAKVVR